MTAWQVTAEMVVVPASTPFGTQMVHVNRRGMLPDGVPAERIAHLLSMGMIQRVEGAVPTSFEPDGDTNSPGEAPQPSLAGSADEPDPHPDGKPAEGAPQDSVSFDDSERAAARAKLPSDGSLPDGRAAQAVWVEAAVARGYDYDVAKGASKDELRDLLNK